MRYVATTRVIFMLCILTRASAQLLANSDRPGFSVGVYDYAGIPAPLLAKAEKKVTAVFGNLGIQVKWSTCLGSGASTCDALLDDGFIQLNLVDCAMAQKFGFDKGWLGAAVGRTIYFFYQPLQETLGDENPEMPQALGNLIVHELGHILLPSEGHSKTGIMHAIWSVRDLQERSEFTPIEQRQLRKGCEPAHSQAVGVHQAIVPSALSSLQ